MAANKYDPSSRVISSEDAQHKYPHATAHQVHLYALAFRLGCFILSRRASSPEHRDAARRLARSPSGKTFALVASLYAATAGPCLERLNRGTWELAHLGDPDPEQFDSWWFRLETKALLNALFTAPKGVEVVDGGEIPEPEE